jgi:uncharacterized protein (TIGR03437 family)
MECVRFRRAGGHNLAMNVAVFFLAVTPLALCQAVNPIPPTFFAMSGVNGAYPPLWMGTLAHQEFAWTAIERSRGVFDFSLFDGYVATAVQNGLVDSTNTADVAVTLASGTPAWAVANQAGCSGGTCPSPPDNIQDWKDFVAALTAHYSGTGKPRIRYYELWNEFNLKANWSGTNAQLLSLAQAAYPVIHALGYSKLLTPSVAGSDGTSAMSAYLQAGGSRYADGGAFHGYLAADGSTPYPMPEDGAATCPTCYGTIVGLSTAMRSVFDQNGLSGKSMYQTHGGWGFGNVTDPGTQVAWLARYLLLQAGLRVTLNLPVASWFDWSSVSGGYFQPTAPGLAYNQLFIWLVGASATQPCSGFSNGTWVCSFTRSEGYVAQAVWNTQGGATYTPGPQFVQFRDLAGNTTAISAGTTLNVGPIPILFEGTAPGTGATAVVSLVANAAGEVPVIAPNTWVELKGFNLVRAGDSRIWRDSDFINGQMPTQLDGVSISVNGRPAFVYYVSPTQINFLTPPDALTGQVPVRLTLNGGVPYLPFNIAARSVAPALFVYNGGPYAAAEHANGRYIGPPGLYPGRTTPASPGETVLLFGNGFGAPTTPIQSGLPVQSGRLPALPTILIGGVAAKVTFAGLIAPGEYQFNVIVPNGLDDGDQPVTAIYNGVMSQPGVVLTIQN